MNDLVKHRLDMAADKLKSAKILLDERQYKDSIGRSYYAIFSSLRAVLAIEEKDFSKHSAVIAYFQKEYIKTGKFHIKYSKYVQQAFQIRNSCDYDDFFVVSKQEADEQYQKARGFYQVIKNYLEKES